MNIFIEDDKQQDTLVLESCANSEYVLFTLGLPDEESESICVKIEEAKLALRKISTR